MVCFNYSKLGINLLSVIITIYIFCIFELCFCNSLSIEIVNIREECNVKKLTQNILIEKQEKNDLWKIEIPKINLEAIVAEGTEESVLDYYVGHFEESPKDNGNVCLAAHNRGYNVNYFANLKDLSEGDEIFYTVNNIKKKYLVNIKTIISETDWSMLKNTEENKITLITCLEDEPEYRRCIQAIEIKEEILN